MILETGKDTYLLDDLGIVDDVCVRRNGIDYALNPISSGQWAMVKEKQKPPHDLRGVPTMFAVLDGSTLAFYPCPDQDYEAIVSYYPAMRMV
jgi:hypothetical protein